MPPWKRSIHSKNSEDIIGSDHLSTLSLTQANWWQSAHTVVVVGGSCSTERDEKPRVEVWRWRGWVLTIGSPPEPTDSVGSSGEI